MRMRAWQRTLLLCAWEARTLSALGHAAPNPTVFMPGYMMQRTHAGPRRTRRRPVAWHKGLLLGVLFVLMSLCHGLVSPVHAAIANDGPVAVASSGLAAVADDDRPPVRECAASKRMVAPSDRRGAAATLDLPAAPTALTAHLPDAARSLRLGPPPIPGNHRAFLQVFRI